MKKISKLLLLAVLALGVSFTACNNNDVPNVDPNEKGSTYASVSISFPTESTTTRGLPEDYRPTGEWKGVDAIEEITVFLVNESLGTIDYTTFTESSFHGISDGVLKPNLAVATRVGDNVKAYVVVNDVNNKVTTTLKGKNVNNFADGFSDIAAALASEVAKNNDANDIVMMTNSVAPTGITVAAGVSEADAIAGNGNRIKVDVERVVARAIVNIQTGYATSIDVKDANGEVKSLISIDEITYAVGQSNKNFHIMKKSNYDTPDPVWSFVPASGSWDTNNSYFDYSGLENFTEVDEIADNTNPLIQAALEAEKGRSKFVLPVTHRVDAEFYNSSYPAMTTFDYRKGNTTYFEVRVAFSPDKVDGEVVTAPYTVGDVYLGLNDGLFYSTRELANASGQKSTKYRATDGKLIAKYVLWLNPDVIPGTGGENGDELAKISPVVRNQVYHVMITGFKEIGVPYNPLDPEDPKDPEDPETPIDPEDPLETEKSYLSVEITPLNWNLHTFKQNVGNDY